MLLEESGPGAVYGWSRRGHAAVRAGRGAAGRGDSGRRPGRGRAGPVHERAGRLLPDQPGHGGQGHKPAGRRRPAGKAPRHRDVRGVRRAPAAARAAPRAVRRAVRRAADHRGGAARHRHRRSDRPGQGVVPGASGPRARGCHGMTPPISVTGLTRRYRDHLALDQVSLEVEAGSIIGLLGRNGAGKTTLLRILAGQEFPSSGSVLVHGAPPVENEAVLRRMVFVREDQTYPDFRVRHALRVASWFYPHWSADLADALLADFDLPPNRAVKKLSRGMRSALGIVIGLAARAEVTMFDEPYAGLDAVARQIFYDRLLADYAEHPRTILLSTHLIDEAAGLLERVVVIDRGRIVLTADADDLRGVATAVSGPVLAVDEFAAGHVVWGRRRLAGQASVVVVGPLDQADQLRAGSLHLDLAPLSLQQLVVQVAGQPADTLERTTA